MDERARVSAFYDDYGEREWLRLDSDARGRVIFHLHMRQILQYISAGDLVLDVGSGAGRFTVELARLGARCVAGDISAVQIALARSHCSESGLPAERRPDFCRLDASSLPFATNTFDHVVGFGAVLCHMGAMAEAGLAEMARVCQPGGYVFLSMTPVGNYYLPWLIDNARKFGPEVVTEHLRSGNQIPDENGVPWRVFGSDEVSRMASDNGCEVVAVSASNVLATVASIPLLEEIERDPVLWQAFLSWEEHLSTLSRNIESGSQMIVVLRKRA